MGFVIGFNLASCCPYGGAAIWVVFFQADYVPGSVDLQSAATHQVGVAVSELVVAGGIPFATFPVQHPHLGSSSLAQRYDMHAFFFRAAAHRAAQIKPRQVHHALYLLAACGFLRADLYYPLAVRTVAISFVITGFAITSDWSHLQ
ncbi:hypothetical protein D3C85_1292080 [compost metagenome]